MTTQQPIFTHVEIYVPSLSEPDIDYDRCRAAVWDKNSPNAEQCRMKAITSPDRYGYRYCGTHSEETVAKRETRQQQRSDNQIAQLDRDMAKIKAGEEALAFLQNTLVPELFVEITSDTFPFGTQLARRVVQWHMDAEAIIMRLQKTPRSV